MKYNLSEITAVIQNRRTIYPENYTDRKVHKEIVKSVLNNALWAPTHGMTQPWRFKVFMDDKVNELAEFLPNLYKDLVPEEKWSEKKITKLSTRPTMASAIVAVCMQRDEHETIQEIEEIEAVACAVQNMHLTCTAYGIGGFWASPKIIYSPKMNEFLGLGEKDKCLGLFYMGYPSKEWPKSHRKPLEYVTEWR